MNTYVQDLWFKALVGGAYEQTVGELRDGDAFCVSGVLCDLHRHATGFEWQQCESAYGDETWVLPRAVSGRAPGSAHLGTTGRRGCASPSGCQ